MSEQIGQLIAALAKAQAKFESPKKNKVAKVRSDKGNYEYRYSDLADLIAAVRGPLAENELAFTHRLVPVERGTLVCTILAHSSGEMLTSEYLVPQFQRQQEFGSALTYAKRYSLSSLLGVAADDDDDGSMADAEQPTGRPQERRQTNAAPSTPPHLRGSPPPAHDDDPFRDDDAPPPGARSAAASQRPADPASPLQAPTGGQLPPPSPEEPPEVAEARRAARAHFWTRDSYAIDPAVIAGGLAAWDAEMIAQASAAPSLDAYLKLEEDCRPYFDAWAAKMQKPVVDMLCRQLGVIHGRLNAAMVAA